MKDRDIVELVRNHARTTNETPIRDITRYVERQRGQHRLTILEVAPKEDSQMAIGIVRVINDVNFEKRLGVEGTPLGKQFLGPFKHGTWKEVIIREPDRGNSVEPLYQFTFFVNAKIFDPSIIRVGATVMVQLSNVKVMFEKHFWVSDDFRKA